MTLLVICCLCSGFGVSESEAQKPSSKNANPKVQKQESKNPSSAVLKLEDVQIEGEIDVPQVLFITARDSRRIRDKVHREYLMSPSEVIRSVRLPRYLHVQPKEE